MDITAQESDHGKTWCSEALPLLRVTQHLTSEKVTSVMWHNRRPEKGQSLQRDRPSFEASPNVCDLPWLRLPAEGGENTQRDGQQGRDGRTEAWGACPAHRQPAVTLCKTGRQCCARLSHRGTTEETISTVSRASQWNINRSFTVK